MGKAKQESPNEAVWIRDLCNHPVLTPKQERKLLRLYRKKGDVEARNLLVRCNQKFVYHIVKQMVPREVADSVGLMELMLAGNMGLLAAAKRFDLGKRNRFSTYASWWIRTTVQRFSVRQNVAVKMSDKIMRLHRAKTRAESKRTSLGGGTFATDAVTYEEAAVIWAHITPADIYSPWGCASHEDPHLTLADVLGDGSKPVDETVIDDLYDKSIRARWMTIRPGFTPREQCIVEKRLMVDREDVLTLDEIGKLFGVSRERVRQLEVIVKERLRAMLEGYV